MLSADRTATAPSTATAVVPMLTPCPWCAQHCVGATRVAHVQLDRTSETTIRRRWAA
jgi:hypothetical protein